LLVQLPTVPLLAPRWQRALKAEAPRGKEQSARPRIWFDQMPFARDWYAVHRPSEVLDAIQSRL